MTDKKSDNDLLIKSVTKILEENPKILSQAIAYEFTKEAVFPRQKILEIIADSFDECLRRRMMDVTNFFSNQYEKHFLDNLTSSYDRVLKQYFAENKQLDKKVMGLIKKHLKDMQFEKTIYDFFLDKKDMMMEFMVKQMFEKREKQ